MELDVNAKKREKNAKKREVFPPYGDNAKHNLLNISGCILHGKLSFPRIFRELSVNSIE